MKQNKIPVIAKELLVPFILITSLFALWGFANDITNPMVAAFAGIMEISTAKAALIQFAFYGGYATMALPAAIFIRKYSYKKAIIVGLILYAVGALLFYPAAYFENFNFFLGSLYILTFGLAFLETTANPYILSMGDKSNATRRLNLAQAFNPMGSLLGMFVASNYILTNLQSDAKNAKGELVYENLGALEKAAIRSHDLIAIRDPYMMLGGVVIIMLIIISISRMPKIEKPKTEIKIFNILKNLFKNSNYKEGVIAQIFYVGAQIMCWTFIIQYAGNLGISKANAQNYNIVAMIIFLCSRFLSTVLMKYLNPRLLLSIFATGSFICVLGVILIQDIFGLYLLVATSAFMSLMFPTIYGIALEGLDNDEATIGAAGLVMAIVGGALMPPLQGFIIDQKEILSIPAVNFSFILPLICFIVIGVFGYRSFKKDKLPLNDIPYVL